METTRRNFLQTALIGGAFSWGLPGYLADAIAADPTSGLITLVPEKIPWAIPDKQDFQIPDRKRLGDMLGARIDASIAQRLKTLDQAVLLKSFRKRVSDDSWDGEHVGKWIHAATLAWANTGDAELRSKLDSTVAELCKCQLESGYLGTYEEKKQWAGWDLWTHKYNLIGLITYVRYTGNLAPLANCRKMADLLCKTYGEGPGQLDVVGGPHAGMAPSSVLEPMVLIYRLTGVPRYLEFCHYILRVWEKPNGPHIVSRLLDSKRVDKVGNGKAYEMLSCLNGALELYRTTGDAKLLEAARNAWQDIVENRLYLTGGTSSMEFFQDNHVLPEDMGAHTCENCVTVTWLQLNLQLLRLTGESRFGDELEKTAYNHLLASQKPRGDDWCYFTPLEGRKPYDSAMTCCHSSGPRGLALLPTFAITTDTEGVVVNLYESTVARLALRDGTPVTLKVEARDPAKGIMHLTVETPAPKEFSIKLRVPPWCEKSFITLPAEAKPGRDGYTVMHRTWKSGDTVDLNFNYAPRVVIGSHSNEGKAALLHGPWVLAYDESLTSEVPPPLKELALPETGLAALAITAEPAPATWKTWPGAQIFRAKAVNRRSGQPFTAQLIPFADAGQTGGRYRVWLQRADQPVANLLLDGTESRSRAGNVEGSIIDDDFQAFVTTYDGASAAEDWYAVTLSKPVTASRIVFTHAKSFPNGGWFDTSAGKPKVQIQRTADAGWETIGTLAEYPNTTATQNGGWRLAVGLINFSLKLDTPVTFSAVRVAGKPASGNEPNQAFTSCGELQAFAE